MGEGGVLLQRDTERQVYYNMYAVIIVTVVLAVALHSGFARGNWLVVLFFAALQVFLEENMVSVNERRHISLRIAVILPTIYLCGATQAMLLSAFKGLYDGVKHRKPWRRTMFNSSQFALSTLLASLTREYLGNVLEMTMFGTVVALAGATTVYIFCNTGLVSRIAAVRRRTSWWIEMRAMMGRSFYTQVSSGFLGVLFTLFIMSYGYWGLVVFSALVVNLSLLLKAAAQVGIERIQRKKLEEELLVDDMTGAYNFRHLNNWLCNPSDEVMAVLFMDIDDFAVFNDTYGHAEGDQILRRLVEIINQSVRDDDQVIRYGGDEFVVLLKGMDAEGAQHVAGRIMDNLALLKGSRWVEPITVSLGIAAMPEHTDDKRQLLLMADQAMYQAKELGKNNTRNWSAMVDLA